MPFEVGAARGLRLVRRLPGCKGTTLADEETGVSIRTVETAYVRVIQGKTKLLQDGQSALPQCE